MPFPIYILMMLMAGSLYGFVSPILRMAYQHGFGVGAVTDMQYFLAAITLWIVAAFRHQGKRIKPREWLLIVVIGLTNAGVSYSYYRALTVLPASVGIILLFQFAWMIMAIDILVKRRLPGRMKWIGLVAILFGTVLAVGVSQGDVHRIPLWAMLLGLASGLSYALSLYLAEYNDPAVSPELRSALVVTVAMVVVFILFPPTILLQAITHPALLYWGGWVSMLGQSLPTLLVLMAIPHIGGRMAGVLGTIELPMAVLGAWLLNHETIVWSRWVGILLILAGIIVSEIVFPRRGADKERSRQTII